MSIVHWNNQSCPMGGASWITAYPASLLPHAQKLKVMLRWPTSSTTIEVHYAHSLSSPYLTRTGQHLAENPCNLQETLRQGPEAGVCMKKAITAAIAAVTICYMFFGCGGCSTWLDKCFPSICHGRLCPWPPALLVCHWDWALCAAHGYYISGEAISMCLTIQANWRQSKHV